MAMTELGIFELLLKKSSDLQDGFTYDFPNLQKEAADKISSTVTDIVYETLKQKSLASSEKRTNLLKFINEISVVKEVHSVQDGSAKTFYLNNVKGKISEYNNEVTNLLESSEDELRYFSSLFESIQEFQQRKQEVEQDSKTKLEYIRKIDQENIDQKDLRIQIQNYCTVSSISDFTDCQSDVNIEELFLNDESHIEVSDTDEREEDIKLCYALLNICDQSKNGLLRILLLKLSQYKKLRSFETNFVEYLWLHDDHFVCCTDLLIENFFFVIEKFLSKRCSEILKLNDNNEVSQYLENLNKDKRFSKLRRICGSDWELNRKTCNLLNTLYCSNSRHENIMKLKNYLFKKNLQFVENKYCL